MRGGRGTGDFKMLHVIRPCTFLCKKQMHNYRKHDQENILIVSQIFFPLLLMLFRIWVFYVEPVLFRIRKKYSKAHFIVGWRKIDGCSWIFVFCCAFSFFGLIRKRLETRLPLGREGLGGRGWEDRSWGNHAFSPKGKNLRFRPRCAFSLQVFLAGEFETGGPCCHAGFVAFLLGRDSSMEQALVYVWKIYLHLKNNCVHGLMVDFDTRSS